MGDLVLLVAENSFTAAGIASLAAVVEAAAEHAEDLDHSEGKVAKLEIEALLDLILELLPCLFHISIRS